MVSPSVLQFSPKSVQPMNFLCLTVRFASIPSLACAIILPITCHDRPIVARLIGHEQFLQRCKDPPLAKGIGTEVTEKLIVVIQHMHLKTGATGGAEGHPSSL